jgi:hypothetical protein
MHCGSAIHDPTQEPLHRVPRATEQANAFETTGDVDCRKLDTVSTTCCGLAGASPHGNLSTIDICNWLWAIADRALWPQNKPAGDSCWPNYCSCARADNSRIVLPKNHPGHLDSDCSHVGVLDAPTLQAAAVPERIERIDGGERVIACAGSTKEGKNGL